MLNLGFQHWDYLMSSIFLLFVHSWLTYFNAVDEEIDLGRQRDQKPVNF